MNQVIGGYVLRRELGRGGMGVVHLAATPTGGLAAVKVIHEHLARDPAFRRRFDREVAAARRVARFCTAPVLDSGLDGGVAYLVTEYVKGPDLAQAVKEQGPLSGANLEALAVGIATALTAIHGAGVVHRDLKPSNVLLSPLGPRVIDFGIAQLADTNSVASQAIVGTPAFMAPEQVRGAAVTPAADVYAWGGVIAYAGTGRLPFGGGAPHEVLYRIVNDGPRLDGLDERMRAIVERAMAKDPARRPTAQELLGELVGGPATSAAASQIVERTWVVTDPALHQAQGLHTAPPLPGGPSRAEADQPVPLASRAAADQPGPWVSRAEADQPGPWASRAEADQPGPWALRAVAGQAVAQPSAVGTEREKRGKRGTGRRWAWVAGGIALVVGVSVGGWAVFGPAGESLPYQADFGQGWAIGASQGGSTEQAADAYLVTAKPGWRLWKSAPAAEPAEGVVVSATARIERGSGEFGVWCRGDESSGDRYEFAVTGSGKVSIIKRHGGGDKVLSAPKAVKKSPEHRVVAQCRQEGTKVTLSMWLDGGLVSEAADAEGAYPAGATGLYAAPDSDEPVAVRFGSFDVTAPKG